MRALEWAASLLHPEAHGVPLDEVRFAFALGDPARLDPRTDMYTGAGNVPGALLILAWPTTFNLPRLPAIAVHELNHTVRFRYEPWSAETTVGKYLVKEEFSDVAAAYGWEQIWVARRRGDADVR